MDAAEARSLAARCVPQCVAAGLATTRETITGVRVRLVQSLWAGMGAVYELAITQGANATPLVVIAKRISLPAQCNSIGDARKKTSYECEASFYANGHAERAIAAGCAVPRPLLVERHADGDVTIVMTKLAGRRVAQMAVAQTEVALRWLARLHAAYWGARADAAVSRTPEGGLQPQGTYWYLDTRPDELAAMPTRGWEGRLRMAAGAIDERLKADPMQTICHGDAKDENMLFDDDGVGMCDFQYCGKGPPSKDVAYVLICASAEAGEEERLIEAYHAELSRLLRAQGDSVPARDHLDDAIALSHADLGRWMSGWGWWGLRGQLQSKIVALLDRLDGGKRLGSEAAYADAVRREFPVPLR